MPSLPESRMTFWQSWVVWDVTALGRDQADENDNGPNLLEVELGFRSELKDIADR
jgi:hypothetical protein